MREKEELRDEMAYSYYYKITTLIASLKNKQKTFSAYLGEDLPELETMVESLERTKKRAAGCFNKFQ